MKTKWIKTVDRRPTAEDASGEGLVEARAADGTVTRVKFSLVNAVSCPEWRPVPKEEG